MKPQLPCLDTLFEQAVALSDPDARRQFIADAAGADEPLRAQLEDLVTAHFQAGDFLAQPLYEAATALVQNPFPPGAHNNMSQHVGDVVGPYKLREVLGQGGMGVVYLAEQQQPVQRKVALKVIKPGMDSRDVLTRFEAERQMLTRLDHPHIAKVLDAGTTDRGTPYFVMEWVKGLPITEHCDTHQLATRDRLTLFLQVCQAVQHAHQKAIIHRDLKPSNVLVAVHDTIPIVKVIDFGVAKALGERLTEDTLYTGVSQLVGTPLYMSPEQAGQSSLDIDTRSDIYSLGVLLYELLTGCTPFDRAALRRGGVDEMRRIIREDEPPRPSERISTLEAEKLSTIAERRDVDPRRLRQYLRGELDWIVMKALDKDRNRRYATANALARDIERYLVGDAVEARPASTTYRLQKLVVRHKVPATIAGLIGAGLLTTTLLTLALAAREQELAQRRQEVQEGITGAMAEATRLRSAAGADSPDESALTDANEHIQRALALAGAGPADPTIVAQVQHLAAELEQEQRDQRLLAAIDEAWRASFETDVEQNCFNDRAMIPILNDALRAYGIPIGQGDPREVATLITRHPRAIQEQLVAAFDRWRHSLKPPIGVRLGTISGQRTVFCNAADAVAGQVHPRDQLLGVAQAAGSPFVDCRAMALTDIEALLRGAPGTHVWLQVKPLGESTASVYEFERNSTAAWLRAVVDAADADPWRRRLREARDLVNGGSKQTALENLADDAEAERQPTQIITDLANELCSLNAEECAIRLLKRRWQQDPKSASVNFVLGWALDKQGLTPAEEALRYYTAAVALCPDSAGLRVNLGKCMGDCGKHDEAAVEFREALRLHPNYALAHNNLGSSVNNQGMWDEGVEEFRQALRMQPSLAIAHQNLGNSLAKYREPLRTQLDHADAHTIRGNALKQTGRLAEAMSAYRESMRMRPDQGGPHVNVAKCLDSQNDFSGALAELREAVRLEPHCASFRDLLAWHLTKYSEATLDHRAEAVQQATAAKDLAPTDPDIWNTLGMAHYRNSAWLECVSALNKSEELRPRNSVTNWLFLAMAHWQLGQHDEARKWYDQAATWMKDNPSDELTVRFRAEADELFGIEANCVAPDYSYAHGYLANVLSGQHKYEAAVTEFREALRLGLDSAEAHNYLGWALYEIGQTEEALLEYNEALRLRPNYAEAHVNRGILWQNAIHDDAEAETAYREALRIQPDLWQAHHNLSMLLAKQGQIDEAITHLREVLKTHPEAANLHNDLAWRLIEHQDPASRHPTEALEHAKKAVELDPIDSNNLGTLGVAHYRNGAWQEAAVALNRSEELATTPVVVHQLFLAMAHWQMGQHDEAHKWYDRAAAWMNDHSPDEDTTRFRTEADELFGVNVEPSHSVDKSQRSPHELREETLRMAREKLGADHPDTLWYVNDLALAYAAAGRTTEAIQLHEEALQLKRDKLGAKHSETLISMNNLAVAYVEAGRTAEAIRLHEEVLRLYRDQLGADHPDTLNSMNNLAGAYSRVGRTGEAIQLHVETLCLQRAILGADDPHTLTSMHNLASSYRDAGRTGEALQLHEETLRLQREKLGANHPETLRSMNSLAVDYCDAGRTAESISLHEETLRLQREKLGTDHPETLSSMNNLASACLAAGRTEEAIQMNEETLRLRREKLGADDPRTLNSMNNLASDYCAAGRLDESIQLHKETLRLRTKKLGADHPRSLDSMRNLAATYCDASDTTEAKRMGMELLPLRRKKEPDSVALALDLAEIARICLLQDQFSEAEGYARECLEICQAKIADDWQTFNAQCLLGHSLLGQKKFDEAEPLLLAGYQGMKEREAAIPAHKRIRINKALDALIQLYTDWEKPESAEKWRQQRAANANAAEAPPVTEPTSPKPPSDIPSP